MLFALEATLSAARVPLWRDCNVICKCFNPFRVEAPSIRAKAAEHIGYESDSDWAGNQIIFQTSAPIHGYEGQSKTYLTRRARSRRWSSFEIGGRTRRHEVAS